MSGNPLLSVKSDILDVSKIELGESELEEEEFDPGRAISACHSIVSERVVTENVSLFRKIDNLIPRIIADERCIKQILINLLSNAVKYTPSGGDIAHVLIPFGRVTDSTIHTFEETDLGLSITKSLTELHGGFLDLLSKLGVGTRISIVLPAHSKVPNKPQLHDSAN